VLVSVDSLDAPGLDDYRELAHPDRLADRARFVAEGRLVVERLIRLGSYRLHSLLLTDAAAAAMAPVLADVPAGVPIYVAGHAVMNGVVGFNIHRGCLAAGRRPVHRTLEEMLRAIRPHRVVILERISNADNVGGIFRSAAALGGDAVVLGPHCCDPLYRKAIRTSIGASLELPFAPGEPWPDALALLRDHGFRVVACTPAADAMPIEDAGRTLAEAGPLAILLGAEGDGLSKEALAAASDRVRIGMRAGVDSLNVTVAAGIAMHRLWRVA
jgi:tRNA G18 (ribose-2'-O)-methylase SpoU